ncbi:hypothetical protein Pcinc_039300 [Petrolisthes cinctipes]|uniref:tRNA (guanine(9)-N(1))-methyltransferase n=1 Tax=Petrolisthes cinctipes TaxID=88211 RepID=A0AAE1EKQ4_PETCI|nr:hypothetical protein Pcinc_039300 [Petrolisthes cinctipes]
MEARSEMETRTASENETLVQGSIFRQKNSDVEHQEDKINNGIRKENIEKEPEITKNENTERSDECQEIIMNENFSKEEIDKNDDGTPELSKRQRKKLLKRKKWLETKSERRQREREKLRLRMEAKRVAGEPRGNIRKQLKRTTMATSACHQQLVIDMSFDDLMIERHLCQCVKQVSRCYSANRRTTDPAQLYVTNFTGKCASIMARQNGYQNWDVHFKPEHFTEIFDDKDKIIYLTSESENVVTSLDDQCVYVIGGLVDHNLHKGLCLRLAKERGLRHARLPIDEFVKMKTRKVLTIDQVFRIILGVAHRKSWKDAFLDVIPARKGAVGKEEEEGYQEEEQEEEEGKGHRQEGEEGREGQKIDEKGDREDEPQKEQEGKVLMEEMENIGVQKTGCKEKVETHDQATIIPEEMNEGERDTKILIREELIENEVEESKGETNQNKEGIQDWKR